MEMIKNLLVVFIGSGLGGGCRFVLSKLIQGSTMMAFPLATFIVNILGCLLIGLFYGMFDKGALMNNNLRLLLTVGFCGGFTTFSTFMNENLQILRANNILLSAFYTAGSLFLGLIAVYVGYYLVKQI
jgi:CrcB protein